MAGCVRYLRYINLVTQGSERPTAVLVLGAGWSVPAGFPLARDLLRGPIYVTSEASRVRVQAVLDAFVEWSASAAIPAAEVFLAEVEAGQIRMPSLDGQPTAPTLFDDHGGQSLPWRWALETVEHRLTMPDVVDDDLRGAVLAPENRQHRLRYGGKITSPLVFRPLINFTREMLAAYTVIGAVTTNYDTLAERVLRHRQLSGEPEPGFHYGGLPQPQWAIGTNAFDRYNEPRALDGRLPQKIQITGRIPLCKLHGSLNWRVDGTTITICRDRRLTYHQRGGPAIVAPTPEKTAPGWLAPIWRRAKNLLSAAETWVVVGYSLPEYDYAARDLLRNAAATGHLRKVVLHDPYAEYLVDRWASIASVEVTSAPGIGPGAWTVTPPRWWKRQWIQAPSWAMDRLGDEPPKGR